jgi:hypothetical protein
LKQNVSFAFKLCLQIYVDASYKLIILKTFFFFEQKLAQQSKVKLQDFEKHGKVFVLEENFVEELEKEFEGVYEHKEVSSLHEC